MATLLLAPLLLLAVGAFGPALFGVAGSAALRVVARLGLLDNIRAGARTRVSVQATALRLEYCCGIWRFLRSPIWGPLFRLRVPFVRVSVVILAKPCSREATRKAPRGGQSGASIVDEFAASSVGLRDLTHPAWRHLKARIRWLRPLCRLTSLFAVSLDSITLEIVQEGTCEPQDTVRVEDASVHVRLGMNSSTGELAFIAEIGGHKLTKLELPNLHIAGHLGLVALEIFTAHMIQGTLGLRSLIQACNAAEGIACSEIDQDDLAANSIFNNAYALAQVIECVPNIKVVISSMQLDLVDSDLDDTGKLSLVNVDLRLADRTTSASSQEPTHVQKSTELTAGPLELLIKSKGNAVDDFVLSPILTVARLKAKVDANVTVEVSDDGSGSSDDGEECRKRLPALGIWIGVRGEVQGISATLSNVLAPWVQAIYSEWQMCSPAGLQACDINPDSICLVEVESQFKFTQCELLFAGSPATCEIIPSGVPSVCVSVDEITLYAHPNATDDQIGVRSRADLQAARLKMYFLESCSVTKTLFLCLDFTRVFIAPISLGNLSPNSAEVEMEAEWLELKWAPEILHGIAGILELGIAIAGPIVRPKTQWQPSCGTQVAGYGLTENVKRFVPSMRSFEEVENDITGGSHTGNNGSTLPPPAVFRCTIKRVCATFVHQFEQEQFAECLTAETCRMSVQNLPERFGVSVDQIKVVRIQPPDRGFNMNSGISLSGMFQNRSPPRRQSFKHNQGRSNEKPNSVRLSSPRRRGSLSASISGESTFSRGKVHEQYFYAARFALEETKVRGGLNRVVDMFADDIRLEWSMPGQLRITELVRNITFACWEMLYRVRVAYAQHCTPENSVYNRPCGLNSPLDDIEECRRWRSELCNIISGSGNTLHRMKSTRIHINAPLSESLTVNVKIGFFGGDDLPDLWHFRNIALTVNELEMARVDGVRVRHTVAKRSDYVFGEFEAMVRVRMEATRYSECQNAQNSEDGMEILCNGIHFVTSSTFPFCRHASTLRHYFEPFEEAAKNALCANWRPQSDLFYRYFLRTPPSPVRSSVWMDLSNVSIRCLGTEFEDWLEQVYPKWMQELEERGLRAEDFEEKLAAFKLANPGTLSVLENAEQEMDALLGERDAQSYVQKMKRQLTGNGMNDNERSSKRQTALLDVSVDRVGADIMIGDSKSAIWEFIKKLDEATDRLEQQFRTIERGFTSYEPLHRFLACTTMDIDVKSVTVQMRRFLTPVFHCDSLGVSGRCVISAFETGGGGNFDFTGAVRCFSDINVHVDSPAVWFCPSYIHALQDVAKLCRNFVPWLVFNVDKRLQIMPWDILRRIFHGKLEVSVDNASVRLLSTSSSFELSDHLALSIGNLNVMYTIGKVEVDLSQVTAKIEPWSLSNCTEISSVKVQIWLKWSCEGHANMHYVYPIEFQQIGGVKNEVVVVNSHIRGESQSGEELHSVDDTLYNLFKVYEATGLSIYIDVSIGSIESEDNDIDEESHSKREARPVTAVLLYRKHVEWMIRFGRIYAAFIAQLSRHPPRDRPERTVVPLNTLQKASASFTDILTGVIVENFAIVGIDVALYKSEKHPIGIRTFIGNKIVCSGALLHQRHNFFSDDCTPTQNTSRRLLLPGQFSGWVVHAVYMSAREVEVRVCSLDTGSRGDSLLQVNEAIFRAGDGDERLPTHCGTTIVRKREANKKKRANLENAKSASLQRGASKTILEHFAIAQPNPFHFRDSESNTETDISEQSYEGANSGSFEVLRQQGFLLGIFSRDIRVLVGLQTLKALMDIGEDWFNLVSTHCPELLMPKSIDSTMSNEPNGPVCEEGSPKRATSLAEDPKFGRIFDDYVRSNDCHRRGQPSPASVANDATLLQTTLGVSPEPLLVVQFVDCQVSIQDQESKGCLLLALSKGTLKNSVAADTSNEDVELNVEGVQMFTAPLDIDIKSRAIWLRAFADGSYCPSSSGLFKRVIAPNSAAVTVRIERIPTNLPSQTAPSSSVSNKVQLSIPTIDVTVAAASKDILQNLLMAVIELVDDKLATIEAQKQSQPVMRLVPMTSDAENGSSTSNRPLRLIRQIEDVRKQLKWKLAYLEWQQACRWNHYVTGSTNPTIDAHGVPIPPHVRRRRVSAAASSSLSPRKLLSSPLASSSVSGRGSTLAASLAGFSPASSSEKVEQIAEDLARGRLQYDGLSDLLASMIKKERERFATQPNIEFEFTLDRAELSLSGESADILSAVASTLQFSMKQYEDRSGAFALTLRELIARNLTPGSPYPEMLQLAHSRTWTSDNHFLRVDGDIGTPADGITVIKHFEVNVHPIQVCITQDTILQLISFFAPPTATSSTSSHNEDRRRKQVRSQFMQAYGTRGGAPGSPSERLVGEAASKLKRAARVASKAAAYPRNLARGVSSTMLRDRDDGACGDYGDSSRTSSRVLHNAQDDAIEWMSRIAHESDGDHAANEGSENSVHDHDGSLGIDNAESRDKEKKLIAFKRIRFGTLEVTVTYKSKRMAAPNGSHAQSPPHQNALEDMRGFEVKIHPLVYCDKTCSATDLLLRIRRDIVLDVLSQVGRNFTNIGNLLRDQFDLSRWAPFDALAPLRSLAAVAPLQGQQSANGASPRRRPSLELPRRSSKTGESNASEASDGAPASATSSPPSHRGFQLELPQNHPSLRKKASHAGPGGFLRPSELLSRSPRAQAADSGASPSRSDKQKKSLSGLFSKKKSAGEAAKQ